MNIIGNTGITPGTSLPAQQPDIQAQQAAALAGPAAPALTTYTQSDTLNRYSALASVVDKWRDATQAITNLSHAPQQIKQSKKAFAAEMIQRIKEQLKVLMMMGGGDPKAKAQQIARLSRQLAAAAQEYAAATGGSQPDTTAAATANAPSTAGAPSDGSSTNAAATDSSTAPTADGATNAAAPAVAASAGATTPTDTAPPATDPLRSQLAEYAQNADSPDAQADREFAAEVRRLAGLLKMLAKQNEVHAPLDPHRSTDREMAAVDDALKEVERSLASIEAANGPAATSVDIVAK